MDALTTWAYVMLAVMGCWLVAGVLYAIFGKGEE